LESDLEITTDICIIGAGPAAQTVAARLEQSRLRIYLVETGPSEKDVQSQSLNLLEPSGTEADPYLNPLATRWRQVGGTAAVWNTYLSRTLTAARYLRLDPIDFERREWIDHSGWPISYNDLAPYYDQAEDLCLPHSQDEPWVTESDALAKYLSLESSEFRTSVDLIGHGTVFTKAIPERFFRSAHTTLLTNSTVTSLVRDKATRSIQHAEVKTLSGNQFRIAARFFILAAGGIENARLMLLSEGPRGLGNEHGIVGKFFMDHQRIDGGVLIPNDKAIFDNTKICDIRASSGPHYSARLNFTREKMLREKLLNVAVLLRPIPNERLNETMSAMTSVFRSLKHGRLPAFTRDVANLIAGSKDVVNTCLPLMLHQRDFAPNVVRGGWSYLSNNAKRFVGFNVQFQIEQVPEESNRVELGLERDAFGQRRARVYSSLSNIDIESFRRARSILAAEFERAGIGNMQIDRNSPVKLDVIGGTHHHMGTTRMHADPREGVVDANCQVYTVPNLYVAGSSVFPTGGYANPTLTILALSLRLADHLATSFDRAK
jgi:choline dehydrogenase-like flavoprotein